MSARGVCALVLTCLCVCGRVIWSQSLRDLMLPHAEEQTVDQRVPRLPSTWRSWWSGRYPISPVINQCPVTQQEASLYVPKACRAIKSPSYFPISHRAACEQPQAVNVKAYVHWIEAIKQAYTLHIQTQTKTCISHEYINQAQTGWPSRIATFCTEGGFCITAMLKGVYLFIYCLL